ncbi:MAG: urate hydroxylase PuuD [Bdellovibrionota bacterium]
MNLALFSTDGILFLLRWLHIFFGIVWIGHLYYFNFVQGAFFAETDAATKSNAIQKLVPRALWWFRWGAMFTLITGLIILMGMGHQNPSTFVTARGILILTGGVLGILMWYNVWFVIWPAQKVVIQSALDVASGKPANPEAAGRGARATVASRTNVLFSIPMIFFMASSTHLPLYVNPDASLGALVAVLAILIGALEFNALKGKTGPMTTVKGVIHCGFGLTVVLYLVMEFLTK